MINRIGKKIILTILRLEAMLVLKRFKPSIIGVSGSVGKTTTKEAIATLLGEHYRVGKSPKSYNSEIGVPLAILGLQSGWGSFGAWLQNIAHGAWRVVSRAPYPQILVLELGVDRPGDFDSLLSWVKPTIAVITAIGDVPVHVEYFASVEDVAKEKAKLVQVIPQDGCVILNADDPQVLAMRELTQARVLTYGVHKEANIVASGYKALFSRSHMSSGISFRIDCEGKSIPIKNQNVIGVQSMYALLATAAVGVVKSLNLIEIAEGLSKYKPMPGRFFLVEGINSSLIIDDSYNASPLAMAVALDTLSTIPAGRKIAVLGDMLELGKFTKDAHEAIGKQASGIVDVLVTVGLRTKSMESAGAKEFYWFSDSKAAGEFLKEYIKKDDVVLVKGSQGTRMERVVEALMAHPEDASRLLVRQDSYWKKH
ncbi:MAG: UDP-N-acetylmuramoyl-tripeptide--D-alanyl-D-alanine ligase [Patescibacteria group bacterium]